MHAKDILSARQIKAARALLDWSQEVLAEHTGLSIATIRKLETGSISPRGKTNQKIRDAFESSGLEFVEPGGLRRRPEEIFVYDGEEGAKAFFDDIYQTCLTAKTEVVQVWPAAEHIYTLLADYKDAHWQRMLAIKDRFTMKGIVTETFDYPPAPFCDARFLSRNLVDSVPFYVYGDKYAIIPVVSDQEKKIIVIQSRAAAAAFRAQFASMWEKATPVTPTGKQEFPSPSRGGLEPAPDLIRGRRARRKSSL